MNKNKERSESNCYYAGCALENEHWKNCEINCTNRLEMKVISALYLRQSMIAE